MSFIHLHSHTEASIADGLFGVKRWVEAYKERGYKAAAITDHGVMINTISFYNAMRAEGMTPILGSEFYFIDDPLMKLPENRKLAHIVLLAKNYDGFQNLLQLSRLAFIDGFYYKPRIGLGWLKNYSDNLVCLTACQGGILAQQVWKEEAKEKAVGLEVRYSELCNIFKDNLFVEFQAHKGENQRLINASLYERLHKLPFFKPIVTNDCHYILPEHAKLQQVLKGVAYKSKPDSADDSATVCNSLWLKDVKQIYASFKKYHEYLPKELVAEGINNTEQVFEMTKDFKMPTGKRYLPKYVNGAIEAMDSATIFNRLCVLYFKRFMERGPFHKSKREYLDRFKKEYGVITKHNLQDYFLIVWDIIRFCNSKGIYVGIGRGSAAGCLISYLLGIVKIDPLEYDLLFERFLNENRCVSGELPDIDLDFESDRRNEVKDYIFNKYGKEHVCEIGTYTRMKLKTCLIDFGKAYRVGDQKSLLSITTNLDLDKEEAQDLDAAAKADPRLMRLLASNVDYAFAVEELNGQIKSQSIHPAGVIICSEKIDTITPIKTLKSKASDDRTIITQCEDKTVVSQGLMKIDLLGLKEYDIVKFVLEHVKSDLTVSNYVDKIMAQERESPNTKVWNMFQQGKVGGVFQFSSSGMKQLLIDMRPTAINDLIAANALFRPGCLENGWHTLYCRRKNGEERVRYIHPDLEKSLGSTYGVICYQEQFMEAIHKLGGISLVDSDTIRSALGKKDKAKLDKFKEQFVTGATKKIGEMAARDLWDQIEKASGYAFNRSHSAVYSVLAYISQYLKVNYPCEFWAAQLEWDTRKNKYEDVISNRAAAAEMGVKIQLPNINQSASSFGVKDGKVLWSFRGIHGIGPKTAMAIEGKRPYKSLVDFVGRAEGREVRFNNMTALIFAGAFDEWGDRRELLRELHVIKGKPYVPLSDDKFLFKFYEVMGFFEQKIKKTRGTFKPTCITEPELREYAVGEYVLVGGMVTDVRTIKTKRGEKMAFATIMDLDEVIELTLFPKEYDKYRPLLRVENVVQVGGTKSGYGAKHNAIEVQEIEER